MGSAHIGALSVTLNIDTAALTKAVARAQGVLARFSQEVSARLQALGGVIKKVGGNLAAGADAMVRGAVRAQAAFARFAKEVSAQLQALESTIKKVGIGLTVGITAPFALMVAKTDKGAGAFEASMNRVQAALQGISAEQLKALSEQARLLGPAVGRSATEAADAIEGLALAGVGVEGILGGALDASLKLAAANNAELAPAATLVTDVMAQFAKTSSDLEPLIDKVTGALDNSKFSFLDYQQAIAQAGGVAGSAGVSFEDFNTAIAATSALFASGSDAGTSFKTFITSLNAKSSEAEFVMEKLGISFFDATGKMKGLADIAQILQDKLGSLSERSRTEALTKMFGTDAMRTAIGLMQKGRKGFEELQAAIAKGDAAKKLEIQMQGSIAASNRMAAAFESLKIALGNAGILAAMTAVKSAIASVTNAFANLPPIAHKAVIAIWALAAALGPLTLAALALARIVLPLMISRLGLFGLSIAFLINPIGVLVAGLARLLVVIASATGIMGSFGVILGTAGATLGAYAGIIGLVATALLLLVLYSSRAKAATGEYQKATEDLTKAQAKNEEIALALASATGEVRKQALLNAKAARVEAVAHLKAAQAALQRAMAERELVRATSAQRVADARFRIQAGGPDAILSQIGANKRASEQADVNARAAIEVLKGRTAEVVKLQAVIAAGSADPAGTIDLDFDKPSKEKKERSKKEKKDRSAQDAAKFQDDIARLRVELMEATNELTGNEAARADLERARIEADRASFMRQTMLEEGISAAQKQELIAAHDKVANQRLAVVGLVEERRVAQEKFDLAEAGNENERDMLQGQLALAQTADERRQLEMRLLDLQHEQERAQLDLIKATNASTTAEYQNAEARLAVLDSIRKSDRENVRRSTAGPGEQFRDSLLDTAAKVKEAYQQIEVDGIRSLEDGILDAITGVESLGDAFKNVAAGIVRDLLRIAIQQNITAPLANMLFGGKGGGGSNGIIVPGSTSGGGLLGTLLGVAGTVLGGTNFGGGSPAELGGSALTSSMPGFGSVMNGDWAGSLTKIPGFAKGGTIRGFSGIDKNLLSINGIPTARVGRGEQLRISPENDNRPSGQTIHVGGVHIVGTGDDRRDRRSGMQAAAGLRHEIARSVKGGF